MIYLLFVLHDWSQLKLMKSISYTASSSRSGLGTARGRPEWGFKKPEPEPDFLNWIPVLINRNRIFSFPIRFLINRNRNFEQSIQFLINRNRNSGWLPDFRFLIGFGHPLSLRAGMCTRYKHVYIQNKHIEPVHTCLILMTTAVYGNGGRLICLFLFAEFYLP